jgi:hypothetical protein
MIHGHVVGPVHRIGAFANIAQSLCLTKHVLNVIGDDARTCSDRLSDANWNKLRSGTFYNPCHHRNEIDGSKVLMFHAKDDPNVPYQRTREFSKVTEAKLKSLSRGGHISTDYVVRKYWERDQNEEDRYAGWRYFIEQSDLAPGTDGQQATKLRQIRLDRQDSES